MMIKNLWMSMITARSAGISAVLNAIGLQRQCSPCVPLAPPVSCPPVSCTPPVACAPPVCTSPPACYVSPVAVVEELACIPQIVVRRFIGCFSPPCQESRTPWSMTDPGCVGSRPESAVTDEATRYLRRIPGEGALLDNLVEHVVLKTGYDAATVRSVILRTFNSNGRLVWSSQNVSSGWSVVSQMSSALKRLGYTDLRLDYRLTAISDRNDYAALIAFSGADPMVLCYPVSRGQVDDLAIREAALFHAGAVAPDKTARYVWVGDGASDYFYDSSTSTVLGSLPANVLAPANAVAA